MTARRIVLALAAGLALADASVVTLALPQLLGDFDTTVVGVAMVLGVYAAVLAVALVPAELAARRLGSGPVGAAGFAVFGLASLGCAVAPSLHVLLVARGFQAAGGAAGLVAAFALLEAGGGTPRERRLWLAVSVLSTAIGPALGGALTQGLSWQSIFYAQAPFALVAAALCARGPVAAPESDPRFAPRGTSQARAGDGDLVQSAQVGGTALRERWPGGLVPAIALGAVSAALTAVLFLLVLLLVAGWSVSPLRAAATVSVLPAAAIIGGLLGGDARLRAVAGCLLVGAGTVALAFLPDARLAWTFGPQALAGLGMGLALPALGGELLPERDAVDAARSLTVRHVGIVLALLAVAPVISSSLDDATFDAREQGVALVLDAKLPPGDKVGLAPDLLEGVDAERPRAALMAALADHRADYAAGSDERTEYDRLARRADDTVVSAVGDSFFIAFLITGGLAILGGAALAAGGVRRPAWALLAILAGAGAVAATATAHERLAPEKVKILKDTCEGRPLPSTDGVTGALQDTALKLLDRAACRFGSTREEYVLALANPDDAGRFEDKHGQNPRSGGGILDALLG